MITNPPLLPVVITAGVTVVSGFVGYLVKTNTQQNTRITVLEASVSSLSDANLHSRVSVVEHGLQDIRSKVAKLDLLERVVATLEFMSGQIRDIQSQIVPRVEHQSYWKAVDDKIEHLSDRIDNQEANRHKE
jgi:hypothetical protein